MSELLTDTRMMLLQAAGELFAEHGYERVTTRMIADKAKVNLSGIHYHFGNKEKLYVEAFRHVCDRNEKTTLSVVLREEPELAKTRKGLAHAVYLTCQRFMDELFNSNKPEWWLRLILREMSDPSSALPVLVREVFAKNHVEDVKSYRLICPEATDDEALVWQFTMISQGVFHMLSRPALALLRAKDIDDDFVAELISTTARAMILVVGLPMPQQLKK